MTVFVRIYVLMMYCLGRYLNLYLPGLVTRVSLGQGSTSTHVGLFWGFFNYGWYQWWVLVQPKAVSL